eukprot:jgi/Picre1/34128/NNA_001603.t1
MIDPCRNSILLVSFPVTAGVVLGVTLNPSGSWLLQSVSWVVVGVGFSDVKYINQVVSDHSLYSRADSTDVEILWRCSFVTCASSWAPGLCLGYVIGSYCTSFASRKRDAFIWSIVLVMISISCSIGVQPSFLRHPDCTLPLGGVVASSMSFLIETPKQLRLIASVVVGSGVSYTINTYILCTYCGQMTAAETTSKGLLHVVWKCPLALGGVLEIVQGTPHVENLEYSLRAMRLGNSMIGGSWIEPESIRGVPIFSAFHLQASGALFFKHPQKKDKRSLHIGLGSGGSVQVLQQLGYTTDCVEIHPEVVQAAKQFFELNNCACQIGDAGELIQRMPLRSYDIIIVDIFSGDVHMGLLQQEAFFRSISLAMIQSQDSILVVNYFGREGYQLARLHTIIKNNFRGLRVYREEAEEDRISNFVLMASNAQEFLVMKPQDVLDSEPFNTVFGDYKDILSDTLSREYTRDPVSNCTDHLVGFIIFVLLTAAIYYRPPHPLAIGREYASMLEEKWSQFGSDNLYDVVKGAGAFSADHHLHIPGVEYVLRSISRHNISDIAQAFSNVKEKLAEYKASGVEELMHAEEALSNYSQKAFHDAEMAVYRLLHPW